MIENYIEYGCTSWGPINSILETGYQCISIIPNTYKFWNCRSHSSSEDLHNYKIIEENDVKNNKKLFDNSILSLILILDHIDNPLNFLSSFVEMGVKYIFLVLETCNKDGYLPVQHLTSWNKTSLIYLSESLGSEIQFLDLKSNLYIATLMKFK